MHVDDYFDFLSLLDIRIRGHRIDDMLAYQTLLRRRPEIDALQVGEPGGPPFTTHDPDILDYAERTRRILVTNNRDSMPDHLCDHWANG